MHKLLENGNIVIDDNILVDRCRQGDSEAMHCLIVKYQDRIYNLILKICRNRDDAAELTQETFVKLIENIDSFKSKSAFYTWLFRIAVNLTYNHCKRKVKLAVHSFDKVSDYGHDSAKKQLIEYLNDEKQPDPSQVAQNREVAEILYAALSRLDEDQRMVIVLRDIEQMSYNDIAETLEIELGTVKSRLSRARANLREILDSVIK